MILYFSGTGNSEYVAKRIGKTTDDEVVNLFDKIRNTDNLKLTSTSPYIIVAPTYAWRIPHIVTEWIRKTPFDGNQNIYFVLTCGGNIANAEKYLKLLCVEKNFNYMGCYEIVMPENYVALFTTPTKTDALKTIDKAEEKIDKVAEYIFSSQKIPNPSISIKDKILSGIVNNAFYPMFVHSKKFFTTNACVSCGKCVKVCPLKNIHLENNKPTWGDNCTHCMACICRCPNESIEYGKHSKGLLRYICPKKI